MRVQKSIQNILKQQIQFTRKSEQNYYFSDKNNNNQKSENSEDNQQQQQQQQHQGEQESKIEAIEKEYKTYQEGYQDKSIYDVKTSQKYVTDNIRKFDWNSYIIAPYYPQKVRDDFCNLNFLNLELMRIPESTKESSLAIGKLEFWDDSLTQIYTDNPVKEPLSIALHQTCKNNPLSKHLFDNLVKARRMEIENKQVPDLAFLVQLSENIRGNMIKLNLQLLRIEYRNNQELQQCVALMGRCLGLLDYIKRIPFTLQKYRLYMPEDLLRNHNISVRTLWDRIEGKPKDELFDVVLEVAAFAKKCLDEAKYFNDKLPPQAFRAMLHGVEAEYYLEYLEKVNFDVFDKGLGSTSYMQMPYRVFTAAKAKKFYTQD